MTYDPIDPDADGAYDTNELTVNTLNGLDLSANVGAPLSVDGQTVFTAEKIVDDFEDQNLSEYSFISSPPSDFTFPTTAFVGSRGITRGNTSSGTNGGIVSMPGDGLANYPTRGDTFRLYYFYPSTNNDYARVSFFNQNNNHLRTGYTLFYNRNGDDIYIEKYNTNGSLNTRVSSNFGSLPTGWHEWVCETTSTDIKFTLQDANTGAFYGDVTFADTTYSSGGVGFQWSNQTGNPPIVDHWTID